MAIGSVRGTTVSTVDLQGMASANPNLQVVVDHEVFEVYQVLFYSTGRAKVTLASEYRADWDLWVAREDYDAEVWEVV